MREREISWEEFGTMNFANRGIHYKDTPGGKTKTGRILFMEPVLIGVVAFVFVVELESGVRDKFVISTFMNIEQPIELPNGRIKAVNPDCTECIIYEPPDVRSFAI